MSTYSGLVTRIGLVGVVGVFRGDAWVWGVRVVRVQGCYRSYTRRGGMPD